jgi:hypothetical protein
MQEVAVSGQVREAIDLLLGRLHPFGGAEPGPYELGQLRQIRVDIARRQAVQVALLVPVMGRTESCSRERAEAGDVATNEQCLHVSVPSKVWIASTSTM